MLRRSGLLCRALSELLGKLLTCSLAGLILFCFTAPVRAQSPAITSIEGETVYEAAGNVRTIGFEFVPQKSILITHVGVYDYEQDGLLEPHSVGIWESSGLYPVTSNEVVIPPNTPREGKFRYVPITPVLLAAGRSYVIGASWTVGKDPYVLNHTTLTTDPLITYVKNRYRSSGVGGGLVYPDRSEPGEKGYFGPNFKFVLASQEVQDTFTGSFNPQMPWQFAIQTLRFGGDYTLVDSQSSSDLSFGANTWNVRLSGTPGTNPSEIYGGLFGNGNGFRNLLNFEVGAVPVDWYAETAVSLDLSKLTTYEELCKYPQAGLALFRDNNYGIWINLTNDARRQIAEGSQQERRSVIQVGVQTTSGGSDIGDSYAALYLPFTPQPDAALVRFRLEGRGSSGAKTGFLSSDGPGYYLYTDYGDGGALRQIGRPSGQTTGPTFFSGDTRLGPNRCYDVLNSVAPGFHVGLNVDNWGTLPQLTARFDSFSTNLLPILRPMTRGRIALQGLAATVAPRQVTLRFNNAWNLGVFFTITRMIGPGASFQDFAYRLPAGQYELVVTAPNYLTARVPVTVTESGDVTIPDITLLAGDVNADGKVNLTDLVQLRSNYGKTGANLAGDLNYDNKVNLTDLVLLRSNYGKSGQ